MDYSIHLLHPLLSRHMAGVRKKLVQQPICAIIGAGEGLGQALASRFAKNGFALALISRSESGSAAAIRAAGKHTPYVRFFKADATNPNTIENALKKVSAEMGDVEVLIYNCRDNFTACAPLEMSYESMLETYNVEVVGAFAAAKSVLPDMISKLRGTIFFSSATAAYRGSSTHPLYSIGKFGLRALSQSLAKAYGRNGVHVIHVRLDCDLDVPYMRNSYGPDYDRNKLANPDAVAESYWLAYKQPKAAWSNEIELRPNVENWTL